MKSCVFFIATVFCVFFSVAFAIDPRYIVAETFSGSSCEETPYGITVIQSGGSCTPDSCTSRVRTTCLDTYDNPYNFMGVEKYVHTDCTGGLTYALYVASGECFNSGGYFNKFTCNGNQITHERCTDSGCSISCTPTTATAGQCRNGGLEGVKYTCGTTSSTTSGASGLIVSLGVILGSLLAVVVIN